MRGRFKSRLRRGPRIEPPLPENRMSPTPAPLTAAQRAAFEKTLLARRAELRAEIEAKLNTQDDPALLGLRNRMDEIDDWAVADLETAMDVAEVSRDAAELQEVEAALARLKGDSYGLCLECGAAIPANRLAVSPMAARCIDCQERLEAAMRRAGAGTL
jgi:DnaK suppressor protein